MTTALLARIADAFAPYRCDALYRLMELAGAHAERVLKGVS